MQPMDLVDITVYYLEMFEPVPRHVPAPRDGLCVVRAPSPTIPWYRTLYNAVGEPYRWLSRRKMSDQKADGYATRRRQTE